VAFLEIEFPRTISYKAVGGPNFSTIVNIGLSGAEQRNQNWQLSRGKWRVSLITPEGFAGQRQTFIDLLIAFFQNAAGRANALRLYDHLDHGPVTSQTMVVVAGSSNLQWQLQRARTVAGQTYLQKISKPLAAFTLQDQTGANAGGTAIKDYQGNALANTVTISGYTPATTFVLDARTGIATFDAGPGAPPTASFQFHYPVRFDIDALELTSEPSAVGAGRPIVSWNSVPLIEVPPPNF